MADVFKRFPKCNDARGVVDCFACKGKDSRCICLSDTTFPGGVCPFYKNQEQILKEDPNYYGNLANRGKQYTSYRKAMK